MPWVFRINYFSSDLQRNSPSFSSCKIGSSEDSTKPSTKLSTLFKIKVMVEGICRGYLELIILQAPEIDLSYVAAFILKRVEFY
jgi:hypothetical protein